MLRGVGPFACPRCHGVLVERVEALVCTGCVATFPRRGGIVDFAPEIERQPGLAQSFMESDAVAAIYERTFRPAFTRLGSSIRYADEEQYLARHVQPVEGPLLDVACGTGRYTRWLAARYGGRRVVGLDLSFPMLRRAVRAVDAGGDTNYVRASALALPLPDATFGAVNCFAALHLFPDPARAVQEVGRVLRPGGSFTGLTACRVDGGLRGRVQAAFSTAAKFHFFDPDELGRELERARMVVVDFSLHGAVVLFSARASEGPGPSSAR
jgi:ubiquinone/menaquinone biosynthesis C-methylase UbiE